MGNGPILALIGYLDEIAEAWLIERELERERDRGGPVAPVHSPDREGGVWSPAPAPGGELGGGSGAGLEATVSGDRE